MDADGEGGLGSKLKPRDCPTTDKFETVSLRFMRGTSANHREVLDSTSACAGIPGTIETKYYEERNAAMKTLRALYFFEARLRQ